MLAKGHMYPAVLLLLLKGTTEPRCAEAEISAGLRFLVVFPENIAYYYPEDPQNQVHVTALYDNTEVTVAFQDQIRTETLDAAQTRRFLFSRTAEFRRENVADKVVRVNSTRRVTVHAISLKAGSVQSARVVPVDALGTEYLVPPIPEIQGTTRPADVVNSNVTERAPFRLILVNAEKVNKVSLEGEDGLTREEELEPHHAAQFWLDADNAWRVVRAQHPVAALFGHPCAATRNCSCSMLYVTLSPKPRDKMAFLVPPMPYQNAEELISENSSLVDSSYPGWPVLELPGPAILHRPGLLLPLIPQSELASCFVVNAIPDMRNFAIILVRKDLTGGVRVGGGPPEDPVWLPLTGSDFVSTLVNLTVDNNAIWHTSNKMAVYYVGQNGDVLFGNPAPAVSQTSDYRGCVLLPDVLEFGSEALGWQESVKFCRDRNFHLVSLSSLPLRNHVQAKIRQEYTGDDAPRRAWIGLRRSTLTGAWYWLNKVAVTVSNWVETESTPRGRCGAINLEPGEDFGWSREDCCQDIHPICYRGPHCFPVQ